MITKVLSKSQKTKRAIPVTSKVVEESTKKTNIPDLATLAPATVDFKLQA